MGNHKNVVVPRMENRDTQGTKGWREGYADNDRDREDWPERRNPGRKVCVNMREIVFNFFLPPSFFPFFSSNHPSIHSFTEYLTLLLALDYTPNKSKAAV